MNRTPYNSSPSISLFVRFSFSGLVVCIFATHRNFLFGQYSIDIQVDILTWHIYSHICIIKNWNSIFFSLVANNFAVKFVPYYPRSTVTLQRSAACCFLSSNFINPWWYHLWDIACHQYAVAPPPRQVYQLESAHRNERTNERKSPLSLAPPRASKKSNFGIRFLLLTVYQVYLWRNGHGHACNIT